MRPLSLARIREEFEDEDDEPSELDLLREKVDALEDANWRLMRRAELVEKMVSETGWLLMAFGVSMLWVLWDDGFSIRLKSGAFIVAGWILRSIAQGLTAARLALDSD